MTFQKLDFACLAVHPQMVKAVAILSQDPFRSTVAFPLVATLSFGVTYSLSIRFMTQKRIEVETTLIHLRNEGTFQMPKLSNLVST